jgi:signal transduction histidine kinase
MMLKLSPQREYQDRGGECSWYDGGGKQGDLWRRIAVTHIGDEFDRLAASMNAMLQRLQELMVDLRQVTSDISHDLRSPLARLRVHLELARGKTTEPELQAVFDEALAQADQALEIFAAMLRIAEVEAGTTTNRDCSYCQSESTLGAAA